jgi:hypothetical protein
MIRQWVNFTPLLLALLVGIIYAGPYVYPALSTEYRGIFMADSGDADFYLSAINKSYESDGLVGDPFMYEYRDARNPFQFFAIEFVVGRLGAALGLPIDTLATAISFVFPALLSLLLYAFALRLSGSRLTALVVATAMLLGNELVRFDSIANTINTFHFDGMYREFLTYSRFINPQASALLFFGELFVLHRLSITKSWRLALISGAALGVLAYIYPYFWMFAFVLLGVVFLYSLLARQWRLTHLALAAGATAGVVMLPFLVAILPILLHGGETALTQAIPTHRIIVEKMILLPLFMYAALWLWGWKGKGRSAQWAWMFSTKYIFVLLLLVSGLIVSNHQIITGKLLFQQHFHFFTNIPLFVLSMSLLYMELLQLLPRRWRIIGAFAAAVVLIWYALGVQVSSYRGHYEESQRYQALAPIFDYLRNDASPSVILTDYYLSTRLTMYTQDYTYTGGYDATFAIPKEQLVHDYFVMLALRGVKASEIKEYLYQNRDEVGGILFIGTYWRDLCGSYGCFPDSVLEDLVPQYQAFAKQPLLQSIRTHKLDYLLWDSKMDPAWRLRELVVEKPILESGDFKLYAVRND